MKRTTICIYILVCILYIRPREEASSCSSFPNIFLVESLVKEQGDGCTTKNRMKIDIPNRTILLLPLSFYSLHPCACYHLGMYIMYGLIGINQASCIESDFSFLEGQTDSGSSISLYQLFRKFEIIFSHSTSIFCHHIYFYFLFFHSVRFILGHSKKIILF